MDRIESRGDELTLRRAAVEHCQWERDAALQLLKRRCRDAYDALRDSGSSSAEIGRRHQESQLRKLGSDGDQVGWRPLSMEACGRIDRVLGAELGRDFGLATLRAELEAADAELRAAEEALRAAEIRADLRRAQFGALGPELAAALRALAAVLSRTQRWLPYSGLDDGFQRRAVRVSDDPPRHPVSEPLHAQPRTIGYGDVSWERAVEDVPVAVVFGDAGAGKTWLLRHHALALAARATVDLDSGGDPGLVEFPVWTHAADLARFWQAGRSPRDAVIDASMLSLRVADFIPSESFRRFVAARLDSDAAPVHVLVDAYDEVVGDASRAALGEALSWIAGRTGRDRGARLVLTSREAGYADPFERSPRRDGSEAEDASGPAPRYLHLGALDDDQVRQLWNQWFAARERSVPSHRLESVMAPTSPVRLFAGVPLIAAFCAWVAEDDAVATTRAGLYGQVVRKFVAQPWKDGAATAGSSRQDPARPAGVERALTELAWQMATGTGTWRDALAALESEAILTEARMPLSASTSATFEAVRMLGILVQPGAPDHHLGDTPLLWIHRSVHEYLVARRLVNLAPEAVRDLVDSRCWFLPQWGNVLDFAIGLESEQTRESGQAVTDVTRELALGTGDALGWFATVFAAAAAGMPAEHEHRRAVVDRVWTLHRAGFISPTSLARILALTPEANEDEIAGIVLGEADGDGPTEETWEALAWCGEPGRTALAEVIESAPAASGAAVALSRVDPAAALRAVHARLARGLPLNAADAKVLRGLDAPAVLDLRRAYLADPSSPPGRGTLGGPGTPSRAASSRTASRTLTRRPGWRPWPGTPRATETSLTGLPSSGCSNWRCATPSRTSASPRGISCRWSACPCPGWSRRSTRCSKASTATRPHHRWRIWTPSPPDSARSGPPR